MPRIPGLDPDAEHYDHYALHFLLILTPATHFPLPDLTSGPIQSTALQEGLQSNTISIQHSWLNLKHIPLRYFTLL